MVMTKSNSFVTLVVGLFVLLAASSGFTQDAGIPDTCDLVFSVIPDATTGTLKFRADLWVVNDADNVIGVTVPLNWDNPNLQMDSAKATSLTTAGFTLGTFFFETGSIAVTNTTHNFLFGGVALGAGVATAPTRRMWASFYFTLSSWTQTDSIAIDTLTWDPGSAYTFVNGGGNPYNPVWKGRKVARDTALPSSMIVTPDSLHYSGIAGGAFPVSQSFVVSSDNKPLSISLVEAVSWIIPTPLVGTTPRTVNVAVNTNFMVAGDYKDSIRINSGTAVNSPQWVIVTLHLDPPPPAIGFSPASFNFNAVANGANPASKVLTVFNSGAAGSTLNWSVTKSQSWLSLAPLSGTDNGSVTLSVDITGLFVDDYYDTVVITGVGATNSPQKVPVKLTVGSDLPAIAAINQYNYWIIPGDSGSIAPKKFVVTNSGSGALTFTVEEFSPRILSLSVASGVAGDTVAVSLKMASIAANTDYSDTVWVSSPEAENSPYPVVFLLHSIDNPAMLDLGPDTLSFTIYECDMGKNISFPTGLFAVGSNLQDDPVDYHMNYESDWFSLDHDSGTVTDIVEVTTRDAGFPVGIYYDSIEVTAMKALNSPQYMIIKINKSAGVVPPRILVGSNNITIPTQELNGPILGYIQSVDNEYGGCMPWTISENVPWLSTAPPSGDVPSSFQLIAESTPSFLFGQYPDSFYISSPGAVNSPRLIAVTMKVWRFVGDVNYDGRVNVVDLVYFVQYLFQSGSAPQPERRVGDVNCDESVNVVDLTTMVDYLFQFGDVLCGNPQKK
jgi:Dockerin type I domain/Viral BACON domain